MVMKQQRTRSCERMKGALNKERKCTLGMRYTRHEELGRYLERGMHILKSVNDLGMVLIQAHIVLIRALWYRANNKYSVLVSILGGQLSTFS